VTWSVVRCSGSEAGRYLRRESVNGITVRTKADLRNMSSPARVPAMNKDASRHGEGTRLNSGWGVHSMPK
jgi:hypothetical protein